MPRRARWLCGAHQLLPDRSDALWLSLPGAAGRRSGRNESVGDYCVATLWRRAAAWATDVFLFGGAVFGIIALTGMRRSLAVAWRLVLAGPSNLTPAVLHRLLQAGAVNTLAILLAGFAVWVAYRVVCTGRWGRTFGKWLFGIQVVRIEDPCAPPGLRRAAIRWFLPPLAGAIPLPGSGLLPYLMAVRSHTRQGGHDRAARTIVVRRISPGVLVRHMN